MPVAGTQGNKYCQKAERRQTMYKKQMILQRIACFLLLAAAALVFLYSLGIMTDVCEALFDVAEVSEGKNKYVEGAKMYLEMQPFNKDLTSAGIILIISAVAVFLFGAHSRRKYYIANYITLGINAVANVGLSVWMITNVLKYRAQFLLVDFDKLRELAETYSGIKPTDSTFWFDIGWVVFAVVIVATVISIANLIFKVVVMNAERKLIEEGKEA